MRKLSAFIVLLAIICGPVLLVLSTGNEATIRPFTVEEFTVEELGGVGTHCAERLTRPLRVIDGGCFEVYSDGTFRLIEQANGDCGGDEKSWCSFMSLRKMPDINRR